MEFISDESDSDSDEDSSEDLHTNILTMAPHQNL